VDCVIARVVGHLLPLSEDTGRLCDDICYTFQTDTFVEIECTLTTDLKHAPNPVYLSIALDHTLSYKQYLSHTAAKLRSHNSVI